MVRKAIIFVACLLALAGTWWVLKPEPLLDLSREEEPFRSMVLPLKEVRGDCKYGGLETHVRVVDGTGRRFKFSFRRNDSELWTAYPRYTWEEEGSGIGIFGSTYSERGGVIISRLIKETKNRDEGCDVAVENFSRKPAVTWGRIVQTVETLWYGPPTVIDCPF